MGVAGAEHDGGEFLVAEVGEEAGEVDGFGGLSFGIRVYGGGEVGRDEVNDGDVRVQGAWEEGGQGARRNA